MCFGGSCFNLSFQWQKQNSIPDDEAKIFRVCRKIIGDVPLTLNIRNIQCINILTWPRRFWNKLLYLVLFSFIQVSFGNWEIGETFSSLQFCFWKPWSPVIIIIYSYYMASSASGQDEPNCAMWLATWAGKMEPSCPLETTRCKNFTESHIINPLLTKFVRSRWLYIALVLFLRVYGPRLRLGP